MPKALQLTADGKQAVAKDVAPMQLEIEYLPSLDSAPEPVDELTEIYDLRTSKAIKVTFKSLLD